MGHTKIPVPNGLYGHKTDLKDAVKECLDNPRRSDPYPFRWLKPDRPWDHNRVGESIAAAVDRASAWDEGATVALEVRHKQAPDAVRRKMEEYDLGEALQETDLLGPPERADWRGFQVELRFGPRGGLQDIELVADYHH